MIKPLSAIWGGVAFPPNYWAGNSKVYDGSFDADYIQSWNEFDSDEPFTFHTVLKPNALGVYFLFMQGTISNVGGYIKDRAIYAILNSDGTVIFDIRSSSTSRLSVKTANPVYEAGERLDLSFSYSGIKSAFNMKIYKNGVLEPVSVISSTAPGTILQATKTLYIGRAVVNAGRFNGLVRYLDVFDFELSSSEVNSMYKKGANSIYPYNLTDYRGAIEFNKTSGNLTTVTNTPAYTIANIGGASYQDFLT